MYWSIEGEDYVSTSEEVQLQPGQQRLCIAIEIVNDRVMEETEDLIVFVESDPLNEVVSQGLTLAPALTDVCITDDDSKSQNLIKTSLHIILLYLGITIGFEREEVSISEGSHSTVVLKVVKIGSTTEPVTVAFTTLEGTAESGVDYEPLSGVLIFSPVELEKEIPISVNDDGLVEGQEHFSVVLSLPMSGIKNGVELIRDRVDVTVEDNDSEQTLNSSIYEV